MSSPFEIKSQTAKLQINPSIYKPFTSCFWSLEIPNTSGYTDLQTSLQAFCKWAIIQGLKISTPSAVQRFDTFQRFKDNIYFITVFTSILQMGDNRIVYRPCQLVLSQHISPCKSANVFTNICTLTE